jgi:hypothetical protein
LLGFKNQLDGKTTCTENYLNSKLIGWKKILILKNCFDSKIVWMKKLLGFKN